MIYARVLSASIDSPGFFMSKRGAFMFDREIKLIGINNYNKLKNSTVMVIGLGGVGGYVV